MINKIKKLIQLGVLGFGVSFIANCAAFDGPSCEIFGNLGCLDLMSIDADSVAAFESDCNFLGTYSATPCDTATYDVPGHCEVSGTSYDYSVFYPSTYNTPSSAEAACATAANSTWVQ